MKRVLDVAPVKVGGPPSSKQGPRWGAALIVEDEPSTREALVRMLDPDCRLTTAKDGHDAIRLAEQLVPDIILLDVGLPDLSGIEVCRILKSNPRLTEVPVVMVTQFDDDQSQQTALEAGANDFIPKPIKSSIVRARVRNLIEARKRLLFTLQMSDARWRFALEGSEFGMWDWIVSRQQLMISAALSKLIGLPSTDHTISPDDWFDWIHPNDRARVEAHRDSLMERPVSAADLEYRLVTTDGGLVWVRERTKVLHRTDGRPDRVMALLSDTTERRVSERRIVKLSRCDPVTELPNRKACLELLASECTLPGNGRKSTGVFRVNLEGLARANRSMGRSAGDELLLQAAQRLREFAPAPNIVSQFGGKEFAVVVAISDAGRAEPEALAAGERLRSVLALPFVVRGEQVLCRADVGVAIAPKMDDPEELVRRAEVALSDAQETGKGICVFSDVMLQRQDERSQLIADLEKGLFTDQFFLAYQPIVSSSGRILGVEALARWRHPERGLVRPDLFIPLAEEAGLIIPLGARLRREACCLLGEWAKDETARELKISVNVSPAEFMATGFVRDLTLLVSSGDFDPAKLQIELTESLFLSGFEAIAAAMNQIKKTGVGFALDDFGTGYSSLSYLKRLPFDRLKVDRSFVRDILSSSTDQALSRTIVAMSESLGLEVVAEGVEDEEQVRLLSEMGCTMFQGYLFGRPSSAEEIVSRVAQQTLDQTRTGAVGVVSPTAVPGSRGHDPLDSEILIVDDDESTLEVVRHVLREYRRVQTIRDPVAAKKLAVKSPPDLLIVDRNMEKLDGLQLCMELRQTPALVDVPVIFITADADLEGELQAYEIGAADFVSKPISAARLQVTVRNQLERKRQTDSLKRQASMDSLTGLANRRSFSRALLREVSRAHAAETPLSLLMIDVDHFKNINDTYGHTTGDRCLERLGDLFRESVGLTTDLPARYGGEEFVVLMPLAGEEIAERRAHALVRAVEGAQLHEALEVDWPITISVGWATSFPALGETDSETELLDAADRALLRAKETGRNRVCGPDDVNSLEPLVETRLAR